MKRIYILFTLLVLGNVFSTSFGMKREGGEDDGDVKRVRINSQENAPAKSLLADLARERRGRNPEEVEQERKLEEECRAEREQQELIKEKEVKTAEFNKLVSDIRVLIEDKDSFIKNLEQIKEQLTDFFRRYVRGYKSNCIKKEQSLIGLSFEEVLMQFKQLAFSTLNPFFELKINDQESAVMLHSIYVPFVQDIGLLLNDEMIADHLQEDEVFPGFVLMQTNALFDLYVNLSLLLNNLQTHVSVSFVLDALYAIELPSIQEVNGYPLQQNVDKIKQILMQIVDGISQNCKQVVDVLGGDAQKILIKLNEIMVLFGLDPIELKMEMDTSNDALLAQAAIDAERLEQERRDAEFAQRLQEGHVPAPMPVAHDVEDPELAAAIAASLQPDEDPELAAAIAVSLQD